MSHLIEYKFDTMMGKGIVSIALAHSALSRPCKTSKQTGRRNNGAIASTLRSLDACIQDRSERKHCRANGLGELGCAPIFSVAVVQTLAKWLSAFAVALMVHSGTPGSASAYELASVTEDKILGIMRTVEAKTESAMTALTHVGGDKEGDLQTWRDLVDEVYDVVLRNFDDSRRSGYNEDEWKAIRDDIVARNISDSSVAHSAIREMVLRLKDPYSRFLSPAEFSAMSKYDISGVGLNLGTKQDLEEKTGLHPDFPETGGAWVVGLIRDSAADDAGIQQGDLILSIEGQSLDQKSPFEVASLFQAPAEDFQGVETEWFGIAKVSSQAPLPMNVQVKRINGDVVDLSLRRPHVVPAPSPVTTKYDSKKRRGYIKLSSFNARAQRDISAAISELEALGADSLVLDLRGNRGGLVSEGIEVAKIFLSNDDVIVRSKIKARKSENIIRASNENPLTHARLSVLVDGGTASASEIVAGALQDNCRAPLIGQNTYGKGLIQSVYELSDGSGLVLTVGSYLTPSGINIDWEGLKPDFSSEPPTKDIDAVLKACRLRNNR